jgi:hypothetical protein
MNAGVSPFSHRLGFRLVHQAPAVILSLGVLLAAGCGGSNGSQTFSGNTPVVLLASSTANDQLSELTLNITSVTLTNKEGKTVTLLTAPQYIEYTHLNGNVEPLVTVSVPQDVYTSATVSANFGVPLCATYDPSNEELGTYAVFTAAATNVTANLPEPITVAGTGMGLELNLQISKSTNYINCPGVVYGAVPFSLTPTFNLTPVTLASQPTNSTNGKASGLRGMIQSIGTDGAGFSVVGDFGAGDDGPTWDVTSNSSTVFQGITGVSQLVAGVPVDVDVAIQPDGTLVATRVAAYDTTPANLSYSIGPLASVSSSVSDLFALAVDNQGPDFVGDDGDMFPYNFANTVFQISGQMSNLSTLPFTTSFNGTNMVPGQSILTTTHSGKNGPYPLASTMTLLPQTINGTVNAISSSGSFTTYTVSLAPYDLFSNLAGQPGQTTLLTNPSTVAVYADSNTQMLNSSSIAAGGVFRFYGLVFNDNGTLRMDCAQVNDGVAE